MPSLAALNTSASKSQAEAVLRIPTARYIEPANLADYYPALLRLALEKTGEPVPTLVEVGEPSLVKQRYRILLSEEQLEVFWSTSTPAREAEFLPVRFNLLRGVNEHRVLVVRRSDLPRFAGLRTAEALRSRLAGGGAHWSDTEILRANGFRVITGIRHDSLFKMLAHGRFDFLALGMAEVEDALRAHPSLALTVEPTLLLHYPQPIYFFVNRKRPELAERILRGLNKAAADGSLDQLYFANPSLKRAWERLRAEKRTVIALRAL